MLVRTASRLAVLASLCLAAACDVGVVGPGGGPGGGDDDTNPGVDAAAATPSYSVQVTPATASTKLGTKSTFVVTVVGSHYTGPVTLTAAGAPSSWMVAINPSTVSVQDGQTATAMVEVTIPTNGDAATAGQALAINATSSEAGNRSGSTVLTVANELVFNLDAGTGTGMHWGQMNGGLLRLKAGTKLTIKNADSIPHRVHTNGGIPGFVHEDTDMPSGGSYSVTVGAGSDVFYCHDHGQGTGEVNVVVQ